MSELDELLAQANEDGDVLIDLSEASEAFEQVEPGEYAAEVTSVTRGTSAAGNAKLTFVFKILGPNHVGATMHRHCPLSGKGAGITRDTIKGLGFQIDPDSNKLPFSIVEAIGRRAKITVRVQKNNPQYNEISKVSQ